MPAIGLVAAVDSIDNPFVQGVWERGWVRDPGRIPEVAVLLRIGGQAGPGTTGLRGLLVLEAEADLAALGKACGEAGWPFPAAGAREAVLLAEGPDGRGDLSARFGGALTACLPLAVAGVLDDPVRDRLLAVRGSDDRLYVAWLERRP